MKKIFQITLAALAFGLAASSCQEKDEFTESIFDTDIAAVDPNSTTAPFDQWLYDNFVVPYNTEIQYKFNFTASDLNYQLSPSDYKKSQMLAHMIKYLFYDVYDLHGGPNFMKQYAPRIFHFIGSDAYSPTTHTETLGYASAGVKITLIGVNNMKTVEPGMSFTPDDMAALNKDQFHTMHHEFSHILHQTKSYPVAFGQVTPGTYDGRTWQERDSTLSHSLGYVTQYASSADTEDFVETLSCAITDTDGRWMNTIIDACINGGLREDDKPRIYALIDSLEIQNFDDPKAHWNHFTLYKELEQMEDSKIYNETGRLVLDSHLEDARVQAQADGRSLKFEKYQTYNSFREFLDHGAPVDYSEKEGGMSAILKKMDIAYKWYTEMFGLHIFAIRREVRYRQDHINDFIKTFEIYELQ